MAEGERSRSRDASWFPASLSPPGEALFELSLSKAKEDRKAAEDGMRWVLLMDRDIDNGCSNAEENVEMLAREAQLKQTNCT